MADAFDVLILGAGPAGMSAAVRAAALGLKVGVVDEQPAPGGQIWRDVERMSALGRAADLGPDYAEGASLAREFRTSGVEYLPQTTVWQVEPGFRVFTACGGEMRILDARTLLVATGAMERPVPFPGWTLPGVMTVGAAQILLKTAGQIPDAPVWIAGNGPLLMLYANQLLDAGGQVAGILNTQPAGSRRAALAHMAGALGAWGDLRKGMRWGARLRSLRSVDRVTEIEAIGAGRLESVRYRAASGEEGSIATSMLLVHEGVVPDIHLTRALGCKHAWHEAQQCFAPSLDEWGQTSVSGVFVAGDGGAIGGAKAACAAGEVAAAGIAQAAGRLGAREARAESAGARERRTQALAIRPFLDALYRPRAQVSAPADATIVCRCEAVTAGEIRGAVREGAGDPDWVKAQTRCGMGPCLGRQCGAVAAQIIAQATARSIDEIGLARVRPPLRPITLAELGSLAASKP